MIYTLTLNPSIDYIVAVENLKLGGLNRTKEEEMFPGGKGINVSLVLKNLGIQSVALGFIGGFTGEEIERLLVLKGIKTDFIKVSKGNSRINVKARDIGYDKNSLPSETEINGMGPTIDENEYQQLLAKLDRLNKDDILVIAGAIPSSMSEDIYQTIMDRLVYKEVKVILDASGNSLKQALSKRPYLVKPNNHELGALYGVSITTREQALEYAKKLKEEGPQNVLVSLGGEGAVLLTEKGEEYLLAAPEGTVINSIGAGDSMVAGFLMGISETKDIKKAFEMAICTGSASAFSIEMATKEQVFELMNRLYD